MSGKPRTPVNHLPPPPILITAIDTNSAESWFLSKAILDAVEKRNISCRATNQATCPRFSNP
jgi:hypothetical protein